MDAYIATMQSSFPSHAADFLEILELHAKSHWHELTCKVLDLVQHKDLQVNDTLMQLYRQVVEPAAKKLAPLALARIAVTCSSISFKDPTEARQFLSGLATSLKDTSEQAYTLLKCEEATWAQRAGKVVEAESLLEESKLFILKHEAQDIDPIVHASYYRCQSSFHKSQKHYDEFYRTALLFLVYSDIPAIPVQEQRSWALDISLAALLGERVYNFGELLGNPVIKTLDDSELAWIHELLFAFNKGDLAGFERIVAQKAAQMNAIAELAEKATFLRQKMQLMALLNFLFNLSMQSTVIPFADVAAKTRTAVDQVEFLLLKALALGIIKGIIDQVSQTIAITWVQARVLDREEIRALASKVTGWSETVRNTLDVVSATSADLHAQQ